MAGEMMDFEMITSPSDIPNRTLPKILCCICGVLIESNPANMCVNCLRSQVDVTEGITKQIILHQCRGCERFLRPPWVQAQLESKELLAICLKKINGLNKVKLIDAGFIWTEPHSRRLKVKLTIQKDVLNGVLLQQVFSIEVVLQNQQCEACERSFTDHVWRANVQVRQRVDHKKTFYLLEQLILKHGAHEKCINVEQVPSGVDFHFSEKSHAFKFIDFLQSVTPLRYKIAKQLISEDVQNAFMKYKFTYAVDLVPLCKDDLVVLPAKIAAMLGSINPLVLVLRVTSQVIVLDPRTLQVEELSGEKYWKEPFRSLMASSRMEEYTVLDIVPVTIAPISGAALRRKQGSSKKQGRMSARKKLAELAELNSVGSSTSLKAGSTTASSKRSESGASVAVSSMVGSKRDRGGAVSLAGGSIAFHGGASSVASTVTGGPKGKMLLADATIMKTKDMGIVDTSFTVRTHLGNILRPGDLVMGYDMNNAVYNDADIESTGNSYASSQKTRGTAGRGSKVDFPDVVLVRKCYPRKGDAPVAKDEVQVYTGLGTPTASSNINNNNDDVAMEGEVAASNPKRPARVWKLKRLSEHVPTKQADFQRKGDEERAAAEFESFLRDLEEDPALRKTIHLYKDENAIRARTAAASSLNNVAKDSSKKKRSKGFPVRASSAVGTRDSRKQEEEEEEEEEEDDDYEYDEDDIEIGIEELLDEMALTSGDTDQVKSETRDFPAELGDADDADEPDASEETSSEWISSKKDSRRPKAIKEVPEDEDDDDL
jgi:NMD protein affecting ribosome stability and mRNA decay/NACalpha-BTF3-like transcription factor